MRVHDLDPYTMSRDLTKEQPAPHEEERTLDEKERGAHPRHFGRRDKESGPTSAQVAE